MRSEALITCVVAGVKYLIHPQKLGTIDATIDPDALVPVTLLTTSQIFDGDVDSLLRLYDLYDDVFIPEFGAVLVEKTLTNTTDRQTGPERGHQVHGLAANSSTRDLEQLPSGPYFLYGPNLYQAWRLYDDEQDAFTVGIIPEDVDSPRAFRPLTSLGQSGLHKSIPVPSKLYHIPPGASGSDRPLSGVRVAVSDALFIKGVTTTLSSRAWSSVNAQAADKSAELIRKLVSWGAVIVGKTKTGQLTAGVDWVDVSAPFSPRRDQYHRPVGSSAGASAALAGYEWLRHVIIDDDRGGTLDLAAQEGLFSLRPSPGTLSLKGTKLASHFSSLTLSARLLDQLLDITQAVSGPEDPDQVPIDKLIRLVDLEASLSKEEKTLYEDFVQATENYLGIKSQPLNLTQLWEKKSPPTSQGRSLPESVNKASLLSFSVEFYRSFAGFRAAYKNKFQRKPYLEPSIKYYWDIGVNATEGGVEEAQDALQDFRDWFQNKTLQRDSSTAIILPNKLADLVYRDEPSQGLETRDAFTSSSLAALLGLPSLVAPFAQLPYKSRVSGETEYRPVSGSVIGTPGSDIALIELVQKSYHLAQWRTRVDTGRLTFPLADNPRNVDDRHVAGGESLEPEWPGDQTNGGKGDEQASEELK